MGALFDKKVIVINIGILLFLILYTFELNELVLTDYQITTSILIWISALGSFFYINRRYRRTKKFGDKLKQFFKNQGYELIDERPMSSIESINYRLKLSIRDIIGIPFSSKYFVYYETNQRVFKARKIESGNEWELYCEIITTWSKKINLTILKENRLTW